jgi:hypothetical protein
VNALLFSRLSLLSPFSPLTCRTVPSITQNYLNMIREAHEHRDANTQAPFFSVLFFLFFFF